MKRTSICCFCCFAGKGNRGGGAIVFDLAFDCDLNEVGLGGGGFGFCRSMSNGSPALRIFVPELIAQPSTPNEPRYRLAHGPGGHEIGDVFLGCSICVVVLVMKLFNVGSRGFLA